MCEPATIGYSLAALVGGIAVSKALTPKVSSTPAEAPAAATPPAPAPVATPLPRSSTPVQSTKTPAVQQLRAANTTSSKAGVTQTATMLTGPSGVSLNPADLSKPTLLGG